MARRGRGPSMRAMHWNEAKHPRDDRGRFSHKGGAKWLAKALHEVSARMGDISMGASPEHQPRGSLQTGRGHVIDTRALSKAAPRIEARSPLGPAAPAKARRPLASELKPGDHARVSGIDQYGKATTLNGHVQGVSTVRMRKKGTKGRVEDRTAVQMAETPSGAGGWRGTVYAQPHDYAEHTTPKPETTASGTPVGRGPAGIRPGFAAFNQDPAVRQAAEEQDARERALRLAREQELGLQTQQVTHEDLHGTPAALTNQPAGGGPARRGRTPSGVLAAGPKPESDSRRAAIGRAEGSASFAGSAGATDWAQPGQTGLDTPRVGRKASGMTTTPARPAPAAPQAAAPAVSERSKQLYDKLLGTGGAPGMVKNKGARQIVEQMEAHGWEVGAADGYANYGVINFSHPDGRILSTQFLDGGPRGDSKPTFRASHNGMALSQKAALKHVTTKAPVESSHATVAGAADKLGIKLSDADLYSTTPLGKASRTIIGSSLYDREVRDADVGAAATQLREAAQRARESAAQQRDYHAQYVKYGESPQAASFEANAERYSKIADQLERMHAERQRYVQAREAHAAAGPTLLPGRTPQKLPKPSRTNTGAAASNAHGGNTDFAGSLRAEMGQDNALARQTARGESPAGAKMEFTAGGNIRKPSRAGRTAAGRPPVEPTGNVYQARYNPVSGEYDVVDTRDGMRVASHPDIADATGDALQRSSHELPPEPVARVGRGVSGPKTETHDEMIARMQRETDAKVADRRAASLASRDGVPPTDGRPDITMLAASNSKNDYHRWSLSTSQGRDRTMAPDVARVSGGVLDNKAVSAVVMNPKDGTGDYRYRIVEEGTGNVLEEGSGRNAGEVFAKADRIFSSQRGGGVARTAGNEVHYAARSKQRPKDLSRGDFGTGPFYDFSVVQVDKNGNEKEISKTISMDRAQAHAAEMNAKEAGAAERAAAALQASRNTSMADIYNRHRNLTREQFDALPADQRERVLNDLRKVRDSKEQVSHTIPSNRTTMGTTIRGTRNAPHVDAAQAKLRELTYTAPPPPDNSVEAQRARLARGFASGSKDQLNQASIDAGLGGIPTSWKLDKMRDYLRARANAGDLYDQAFDTHSGRLNPAKLATALRQANSREQAAGLLDSIDLSHGLTTADMKAAAGDLGGTLRGSKRKHRDDLIELSVGRRSDSEAIARTANGPSGRTAPRVVGGEPGFGEPPARTAAGTSATTGGTRKHAGLTDQQVRNGLEMRGATDPELVAEAARRGIEHRDAQRPGPDALRQASDLRAAERNAALLAEVNDMTPAQISGLSVSEKERYRQELLTLSRVGRGDDARRAQIALQQFNTPAAREAHTPGVDALGGNLDDAARAAGRNPDGSLRSPGRIGGPAISSYVQPGDRVRYGGKVRTVSRVDDNARYIYFDDGSKMTRYDEGTIVGRPSPGKGDAGGTGARAANLEKARSTQREMRAEELQASREPKDNGAKIRAIQSDTIASAELYRKAAAGPSGQRTNLMIGRVRYTPDNPSGEFKITDANGNQTGWASRTVHDGESVYVFHSQDADGGQRLEGWSDSLAVGVDVINNGHHQATGYGLDSTRTSGGTFQRYAGRDKSIQELDRDALNQEIGRVRERLAMPGLTPSLRARAEADLARLEAERPGGPGTGVDTPRVSRDTGGMTATTEQIRSGEAGAHLRDYERNGAGSVDEATLRAVRDDGRAPANFRTHARAELARRGEAANRQQPTTSAVGAIPKATGYAKGRELEPGMLVNTADLLPMHESQGNTTGENPNPLGHADWVRVGMVGNTNDPAYKSYNSNRSLTGGMYVVFDQAGHPVGRMSANTIAEINTENNKPEARLEQVRMPVKVQVKVNDGFGKFHMEERDSYAPVLVPSAFAQQEAGMPAPKMLSDGILDPNDPNYGKGARRPAPANRPHGPRVQGTRTREQYRADRAQRDAAYAASEPQRAARRAELEAQRKADAAAQREQDRIAAEKAYEARREQDRRAALTRRHESILADLNDPNPQVYDRNLNKVRPATGEEQAVYELDRYGADMAALARAYGIKTRGVDRRDLPAQIVAAVKAGKTPDPEVDAPKVLNPLEQHAADSKKIATLDKRRRTAITKAITELKSELASNDKYPMALEYASDNLLRQIAEAFGLADSGLTGKALRDMIKQLVREGRTPDLDAHPVTSLKKTRR